MARASVMSDAAKARAVELKGCGESDRDIAAKLVQEGLCSKGTSYRTVNRAVAKSGVPRRTRSPDLSAKRIDRLTTDVLADAGSLDALRVRAKQLQELGNEAREAKAVRSFAAIVKLEWFITQQIAVLDPKRDPNERPDMVQAADRGRAKLLEYVERAALGKSPGRAGARPNGGQ